MSLKLSTGAHPGSVREGNFGSGTGMICYEFKGASARRLESFPQHKTITRWSAGAVQLRQALLSCRSRVCLSGRDSDHPVYGDTGSIIMPSPPMRRFCHTS